MNREFSIPAPLAKIPAAYSATMLRWVLPVIAVLLLAPLSGCTRYKTWYKNDFRPVERPREREMPMYSRTGPVVGLEFGKIQSRRVKEKTEKNVAKQLRDIEQAAIRMNADAVWDVKIRPVKKTGFTSDPNTPFPSFKGDEWPEYVVVGTAIVYPLREEALRVELGWDDAATTEEEEGSEKASEEDVSEEAGASEQEGDSDREPEMAEIAPQAEEATKEPQPITPSEIIKESEENSAQ